MKSREELEKIFDRISKTVILDDAHFELATDKRMDSIIKFISEEFAREEPLGRSLNIEYDEELKQMLRQMFPENISVLLIQDSTDEIIAVRLSLISRKSVSFDEELKKLKNQAMVTMATFISHKDKESNAYDRYGVEEFVHFLFLGVDRRHRKKGLGTKIMEVAIQFYSEMGLNPCVLKGEGSSNYSQKIYEKFGFETMHEMPYDDYKVDGELVFRNMGEHRSCKVYGKLITPK